MSRKVHPNTLKRVRLAVYRRDGFSCRHCGWIPPQIPSDYDGQYALAGMVTNAKRRRVLRVLELDHIHPYLLGGKFTTDNLQALCSGCNARKGARV